MHELRRRVHGGGGGRGRLHERRLALRAAVRHARVLLYDAHDAHGGRALLLRHRLAPAGAREAQRGCRSRAVAAARAGAAVVPSDGGAAPRARAAAVPRPPAAHAAHAAAQTPAGAARAVVSGGLTAAAPSRRQFHVLLRLRLRLRLAVQVVAVEARAVVGVALLLGEGRGGLRRLNDNDDR